MVCFVPLPSAMTRTSPPMTTPIVTHTLTRGPTRRGFTLLEVLVVVFVAGVVTAMSIGKIQALITRGRVVNAASAMQNTVEAAFALAERNRMPMRVYWSSDNLQLRVLDRSNTVYRKLNLGNTYGLSGSNITLTHNPFEIYPNGLAQDSLIITVTSNGYTRKLWVSKAGMVQLPYAH